MDRHRAREGIMKKVFFGILTAFLLSACTAGVYTTGPYVGGYGDTASRADRFASETTAVSRAMNSITGCPNGMVPVERDHGLRARARIEEGHRGGGRNYGRGRFNANADVYVSEEGPCFVQQ
jgi:hypothetical protein